MCGDTLTAPRIAVLALYLVALFGIDWLGLHNQPLVIVLLGLVMAVTIASWRRTCRPAGRA
jgi:Flp pilus assembly protein TadB